MPQLNLSKLKFALFDWDNTLAESRSSLVIAVDEVLQKYNLPKWEVSRTKGDCNLSFKDNFPHIFGEHADEAYAQYREIYKKLVPSKISTFEKVHEVLDFLSNHGVKIILMTNKERCLIDYELPLLFDRKIFSNIVCGHEAPKDKPHGEHVLHALKGYLSPEDITPENVWVIGDSAQDSSAALAVKALPIRINKPIWDNEANDDKNIIYFNSFSDFYEALKLAKN